jgi:hypothetical protein
VVGLLPAGSEEECLSEVTPGLAELLDYTLLKTAEDKNYATLAWSR